MSLVLHYSYDGLEVRRLFSKTAKNFIKMANSVKREALSIEDKSKINKHIKYGSNQ